MRNRRKIEKFCKDNNIEITRLEFVRNKEYIYGDIADASYWDLTVKKNGCESDWDSFYGDTLNEDVDTMLRDIHKTLTPQE